MNKNETKKKAMKEPVKKLHNMPISVYNDLIELLYVQSYSRNEKRMVLYLYKWLADNNLSGTIDNAGNLIITKGIASTYPCTVAHMDTVHVLVDDYTIYHNSMAGGDTVLFAKKGKKYTGIGGDDKCGIFACLYMLKKLPAIKVVFFTQEETGCVGSSDIDHSFFDDVRYIIQLDRHGKHDLIDTYCGSKTISPKFSSEIGKLKKEHGFKSANGIITDSMNLWSDNVGISCLNMSCGYFRPHTVNEYIEVNTLWNSILFTKKIIKKLGTERYEHKKPPQKWHKIYSTGKNTKAVFNQCSICRKWKEIIQGTKVTGKYGKVQLYNKYVCYSCISNTKLLIKEEVCHICNEAKKESFGSRRSEYKWKWVCNTCYVKELNKLNKDKKVSKDSDVEYVVCPVCNRLTNRRNLLIYSQRYDKFICSKCYYKPMDVEKCDICEVVVETKYGKKDVWDLNFVCNMCSERFEPIVDNENGGIDVGKLKN